MLRATPGYWILRASVGRGHGVDLADRGGRDRLEVELAEARLPALAVLAAEHPAEL
jgi:hypothetical protein